MLPRPHLTIKRFSVSPGNAIFPVNSIFSKKPRRFSYRKRRVRRFIRVADIDENAIC
jgi:hypothetical protein